MKTGKWFFILLVITSCSVSNKSFNKKEYRKSKSLYQWSGSTNELQDGYFTLKANGYFTFYEKIWMIITIKQASYIGRYKQSGDTLYLDWMGQDPKKIKYYLSNKCVIDSSQHLWFIDDFTNARLWGMGAGAKMSK